MFNKFKLMLYSGVITILTLVAHASAASACLLVHYQPEVPESLQDK